MGDVDLIGLLASVRFVHFRSLDVRFLSDIIFDREQR